MAGINFYDASENQIDVYTQSIEFSKSVYDENGNNINNTNDQTQLIDNNISTKVWNSEVFTGDLTAGFQLGLMFVLRMVFNIKHTYLTERFPQLWEVCATLLLSVDLFCTLMASSFWYGCRGLTDHCRFCCLHSP